jgi:hypothetical protein
VKIFIGNGSMQTHQFGWRVRGQAKLRWLTIRPLSQSVLSDDFATQEDVDYVVKQHEKYGMLPMSEVHAPTRRHSYMRLVYSVDGFIPEATLEAMQAYNHRYKLREGEATRREAAIVSNDQVLRQLDVARQDGLVAEASNVEITVQEERTARSEDKPTSEVVAEGFTDERTARPDRRAGRR